MTRVPELTSHRLCAGLSRWCHPQGFGDWEELEGGGGISPFTGARHMLPGHIEINSFLDWSLAGNTEEQPRSRGVTRPALTRSNDSVHCSDSPVPRTLQHDSRKSCTERCVLVLQNELSHLCRANSAGIYSSSRWRDLHLRWTLKL